MPELFAYEYYGTVILALLIFDGIRGFEAHRILVRAAHPKSAITHAPSFFLYKLQPTVRLLDIYTQSVNLSNHQIHNNKNKY